MRCTKCVETSSNCMFAQAFFNTQCKKCEKQIVNCTSDVDILCQECAEKYNSCSKCLRILTKNLNKGWSPKKYFPVKDGKYIGCFNNLGIFNFYEKEKDIRLVDFRNGKWEFGKVWESRFIYWKPIGALPVFEK